MSQDRIEVINSGRKIKRFFPFESICSPSESVFFVCEVLYFAFVVGLSQALDSTAAALLKKARDLQQFARLSGKRLSLNAIQIFEEIHF